MSAAERLAELRQTGYGVQKLTQLDYTNGEDGWTYRPVEFGPAALMVEGDLKARGFTEAPETDTVDILIMAGRTRVQRRAEKPNEYQVWRVPVQFEREQMAAIEAARPKATPLSPRDQESEEQRIARMRAELAAYDARAQG